MVYYDENNLLITREMVEMDECLIRFLNGYSHEELVKWATSYGKRCKQSKTSIRINLFMVHYHKDYVDVISQMFIY
jgi:hypothetical protein